MRLFSCLFLLSLALSVAAPAQSTSCTGLCLQQVSCPVAGQTTSISGVVYAPNGTDPLPNVTVYIPNAAVAAFTPGVSCPLPGAAPSGSPLVGAYTAVDGSYTLTDVPVGNNIPIVIQSGRWRRQTTINIPASAACTNTPNVDISMPQNQSQGDIPKFAIVTGSADQVECVLLKVGLSQSEFTDPSGSGRINFYLGTGSAGARIDSGTPSASVLMGDSANLDAYDVLMLPCEGGAYADDKTAADLTDLVAFADAGGRVYTSHYSYSWMDTNPPFNTVVNWDVDQAEPKPDPGTATAVTSFAQGETLSQWLELTGASTTPAGSPAQISIQTLRHDFDSVNPPTQSWLTLNDTSLNNPVMQFVFDTPVGQATNQCGRVLYNEYHVENPTNAAGSSAGTTFPSECASAGTAMTPQEKLLEFSLFDLTADGGAATLTPSTQDFGQQALNFGSAAQTFTWTNNSTFATGVTYLNASGDFAVAGSNCTSVPANSTCQISVVFTPTVLGARTGILSVGADGTTLTSTLTGTGIPDLSASTSALAFGNVDVGDPTAQTLTLNNNANAAVPGPSITMTGDYSQTNNCGSSVPANSNCIVNVIFTPATTGPLSGTLTVNPNPTPTTLTGNGIDFSLALSPGSGSVIAGESVSTTLTATPIAGFSAAVTLACATNAPAATCTPASTAFTPSTPTTTAVVISTTSEYAVIGYGALGGSGIFLLLGIGSGCLLWTRRKKSGLLLRSSLFVLFLGATSASLLGCSGHLPAKNASYTPAGNYTCTLTATDGFLVHTATYNLTVTTK